MSRKRTTPKRDTPPDVAEALKAAAATQDEAALAALRAAVAHLRSAQRLEAALHGLSRGARKVFA
jgi:Na+-transporting methylmalonyl-CoA/oxaloacetate decarboxylase gamma subunit